LTFVSKININAVTKTDPNKLKTKTYKSGTICNKMANATQKTAKLIVPNIAE
jgi:hypothetical protein